MDCNLSSFVAPKSIAVIGASRSEKKTGSIILRNIINSKYEGKVYPVNPHAKHIQGLEVCNSILDLPEPPDLAIVVVPADIVPNVLNELGERNVKNVIIISAGFKEAGSQGKVLEKKVTNTAQKYSMNILGPNCLGFVNNILPVNATFAQSVPTPGNLRYITQSGAIASSLFDWFDSVDLGYSEFITLGNKADLTENDFLKYFLENELPKEVHQDGLSSLSPIGLYLESISNGKEFLRLTTEISKKNPILLLKPGKTKAAVHAMQSHTGAIAGSNDVLKAAMKQAGVVHCETLEEFFLLSRAFAWSELPKGPRVAIVSNAGGPAVISADAVESSGLELAKLSKETQEELKKNLPREAAIKDPVDVLGDALAKRYSQALEAILPSDEVDSVVVILTPQVMTEVEKTAKTIGRLWNKYKKPIFCAFIGGRLIKEGEEILNSYKIPSFRFPEQAIAAISRMWRFKQHTLKHTQKTKNETKEVNINLSAIQDVINKAISSKDKTLGNIEADEVLRHCGLNTPKTKYVKDVHEATVFAMENGWPVVLKLSAPGLLHKKDAGGVITNIKNPNMLDSAFNQLTHVLGELDKEVQSKTKIQIQQQIMQGIEVIVGVKRDPTFGNVMLFGAGGTYAEVIEDRNLQLFPIGHEEAKALVQKSKIAKILNGYRGDPPYALDKLYDLIVKVGKLAEKATNASDIEINPVVVTLNDVFAVDGKIILRDGAKPTPKPPQLQTATCTKHEVLATQFNYLEFKTQTPLLLKPGQYISVKVDPKNIRAYSIATYTDEYHFGLLVDTRPGGPGSQFFDKLKVGDIMTYMGPFGMFTFNHNDNSKRLLFLATGSGISAVRCMIDTALTKLNEKRPITLYFGLSYEKEIFWKKHFEALKRKYKNFNFEYVIWKPTTKWKGHSGFVTELVKENFKDASDTSTYLCGHPAMIESATEVLLANGATKDKIYKERFS